MVQCKLYTKQLASTSIILDVSYDLEPVTFPRYLFTHLQNED